MDLITELNEVIQFIEDNLEGDLVPEEIAKVTSYSAYHFQRIFNYLTGIPLSEYIRKRRLSMAVFDLQNQEKVIDVALKYGYLSADSFARAFQKQHGVTPSQVRNESVSMELYPPMSFAFQVKGEEGLSCRIERKEAFDMFGRMTRIDTSEKEAEQAKNEFFYQGRKEHWYDTMNTIYGYDPDMMLHRAYFDERDGKVSYMICQYMKDGIYVPDYYRRIHIPGGLWAVFHSSGEKLDDLWRRIQNEWLPFASYELREESAFELYFGNLRKGNVRGEIMIPIKKKEQSARKSPKRRHPLQNKEGKMMSSRFQVMDFIYEDKWNAPLGELYEAVFAKYPNGIYWSYDPRSNEGQHVFLCLDDKGALIGKGHAMIYEKQEDDAPGYAEHRIFMHYRVFPEYEKDEEVLDLLYDRVFECAKELRKQLSNRVCQVCVGNYESEEIYNQHIESKGWPEHGSVYHLTAEFEKLPGRDVAAELNEIDGIGLKEFDLDSMDILRQLVKNDQICFRESISSLENYQDMAKGEYYAYGAFVESDNGEEELVGSVIACMRDWCDPEIVCVMVLPEYRRKHLAGTMLGTVMNVIRKKGYDSTWLETECENREAITMYEKYGFAITSLEKRYMKYI